MFSEKLKKLRRKNGITQEDLAKIIGLDRSSIGKYESSNVLPSPDVLIKMAEIFNVSVDYLIRENKLTTNVDIDDEDIKFALFGDIKIDDEVLDEVKRFEIGRASWREREYIRGGAG